MKQKVQGIPNDNTIWRENKQASAMAGMEKFKTTRIDMVRALMGEMDSI